MVSRIINWLKTIRHIYMLTEGLKNDISDIKDNQLDRDFVRLLLDKDKLMQLKHHLSISPVIWGDPSRLEVSEKAAVSSCFFNTNSGSIHIGDYTFAGSGVSILAGSHDAELQGYLRRDSEFEEGFDIEIGKGVWLASNSTILGPCVIEDDAVIAAGAVVIPGTQVKSGELYAGVPAKLIKQIKVVDPLEKDAEKLNKVVQRGKGILFFKGWTEKKTVDRDGKTYIGRWTDGTHAEIYTCVDILELVIMNAENIHANVRIFIEEELKESLTANFEPQSIEVSTGNAGEIKIIRLETDEPLFVVASV